MIKFSNCIQRADSSSVLFKHKVLICHKTATAMIAFICLASRQRSAVATHHKGAIWMKDRFLPKSFSLKYQCLNAIYFRTCLQIKKKHWSTDTFYRLAMHYKGVVWMKDRFLPESFTMKYDCLNAIYFRICLQIKKKCRRLIPTTGLVAYCGDGAFYCG